MRHGNGAVSYIGGGDMNGMGQTIGVYADMPFDARDQLAAGIALLFSDSVLDALRVNDKKSRLRWVLLMRRDPAP
jgi:hypothetical protein